MKNTKRSRSITAFIIIFTPIITSCIAVFIPGCIIVQSVEWQPIVSPEGMATRFVQTSPSSWSYVYVETDNGSIYRRSHGVGGEWEIVPNDSFVPDEINTNCPSVMEPRKTIDLLQVCTTTSFDYYVILEDGNMLQYTISGGDNMRGFSLLGYVAALIITAAFGFLMGVAILAILWIFPIVQQRDSLQIGLWIAVSIIGGIVITLVGFAIDESSPLLINMIVGAVITGVIGVGFIWQWDKRKQRELTKSDETVR